MSRLAIFIPDELAQMSPTLHRFFDAMIYKLRKNAHKGKWEGMDIVSSLARLKDETSELCTAIEESNHVEILLEAADVANFALILAAIAMESTAEKQPAPAASRAPARSRGSASRAKPAPKAKARSLQPSPSKRRNRSALVNRLETGR